MFVFSFISVLASLSLLFFSWYLYKGASTTYITKLKIQRAEKRLTEIEKDVIVYKEKELNVDEQFGCATEAQHGN